MTAKTLGELVAEFNTQPGVTISNKNHPALQAHDALHVVFNLLVSSARNEEIVAILQAVLKNDATVTRARKSHRSGKDQVRIRWI